MRDGGSVLHAAGGAEARERGEQRRESYSNRFATALEGIDLDIALDIELSNIVVAGDKKSLLAKTDLALGLTIPRLPGDAAICLSFTMISSPLAASA